MKQILFATTIFLVTLFSWGASLITPASVSAQACTGSVNCKLLGVEYQCSSGPQKGDTCTSDSSCLCSDCCQRKEVVLDRDTKSCWDPGLNRCAAGCNNDAAGWLPDGGGCAVVNIPPPPPPPPPITRYGCSGNNCVTQTGGPYTSYNYCVEACKPDGPPPPPVEPNKYSCSGPGGTCAVDPSGTFPTDGCGGGCPKPPDPPPPPVCQPEHKAKTATVWVRVVSKDPTTSQTVAWKGGEGTSPIYSTAGWSVAAPSTDANGNKYFTTYNSYANGSPKTFDLTKNKISTDMNVRASVANPGSHDTIEDACGTTRTVTIAEDFIAHGGMWSNHFCSGGQAYSASGNYPAKSNTYCSSNVGGPVYWNQDTSGEHGTLDCDGTPRIWTAKDRDGCSGGFMQYGGGVIPNQDGVFASMHDQLVPILEFAAGSFASSGATSWIDTSYDGYWSYQYQAWDEWESFNGISTKVTITPPPGQLCMGAYWFSRSSVVKKETAITQNLATGDCTVVFNPKDGGNVLIVELSEEPEVQSCTIQLAKQSDPGNLSKDLQVEYGEPVDALLVGNSNDPAANQRFNIWLEKIDSEPGTVGSTTVTQPFPALINPFRLTTAKPSGGNEYYLYDSPTPCIPTTANSVCQDIVSFNYESGTSMLPLPEGKYAVHCDRRIGDTVKCSGNPLCSANGGPKTDCTAPDCLVDPTPPATDPTDHAVLRISCTTACNACSTGTEVDNCSASNQNCTVGALATVPAAPNITRPSTINLAVLPTDTTILTEWTQANTTNIDYYEVIMYKQSAFATPDDAWTNRTAGAVIRYFATTNGNDRSATFNFPTAAIGRDLTFAIRAVNSPSGANPCAGNPVLYSPWDQQAFTLLGSVSGNIYDDPNDLGSTANLVNTATFPSASFSVGTVGPITLGPNINSYTLPNVPFNPSTWGTPYVRTMVINNTDLANSYRCSSGNGQGGGNTITCTKTLTYSPQAGDNFFVKRYNLAFNSWWQVWGGSVFSTGLMNSSIPNDDTLCTVGELCYPHIVAADHNNGTVTNASAGVPISEATIDATGNRFSENNPPGTNNPRAPGQQTELLENYAYFSAGTDIGIVAVQAAAGDATQTGTEFQNSAAVQTEVQGARVSKYGGNLTLDLSTTKISVPANQKWIIFVPGNLRINGPTSDHSDSAQSRLIQVANGGYLAFIVGGNINIDSQIGYEEDAGNNTIAAKVTPNIEGVYIADGTLKIESRDELDTTPDDYKFVGAGTFVGWGGVLIPRKFDDDMLYRRELNITSPVDLFIHRPDFVTNSPEFMRNKPQLTWQEVK